MQRKVTVLEPSTASYIYTPEYERPKKKVAAYARVSTELEEQQNSYQAQVKYYTDYIKSNPDWTFVEVYSDEGISGTSTKNRAGFNRMIADAKQGKIDTILTKSISRFARNTVDILKNVRELKEIGVNIVFEKEGIDTANSTGEIMITILSSLSQEESHSISDNVRWGKQKSMRDGKVYVPYRHFLGYRRGEDGKPEIDEAEAVIVREIYQSFLNGQTINNIAKSLTARGVPTPSGKSNWSVSTVRSILSNEKYKGDALLQKTYTTDYLSKKVRKNNGELPQYYVSNSHPAIIQPDIFDLVQAELQYRSKYKNQLANNSPFTAKLICNDCGTFFGRKNTHKGKHTWYCNKRYGKEKTCRTPIIHEEKLIALYLSALCRLLADKATHVAEAQAKIKDLEDISKIKVGQEKAQHALQELIDKIEALMQDNARHSQDQEIYRAKFEKLSASIDKQKELLAKLNNKELETIATREKLKLFIETLQTPISDTEFNARIWTTLVDKVIVKEYDELIFEFKNGTKIRETL